MNKLFITGGIAVVAVFAGVWYVAREPAAPATVPAAEAPDTRGANAPVAAPAAATATTRNDPTGRPAPTDPRLAALMVSPDNDLIEFVKGPDGRVIQEIDQDPGSPSFRRPLRDYVYAGDKVVGVNRYRYLGSHTEVARTVVSYKPDGSVDQIRESTSVH